jgi:hypothetical protein
MPRRHGVAVTDPSVRTVDHDLTAACVVDDLARPVDRVPLRIEVRRRAASVRRNNIPSTVWIRHDMSVVAGHRSSFRRFCTSLKAHPEGRTGRLLDRRPKRCLWGCDRVRH